MRRFESPHQLLDLVGATLGTSTAHIIGQERIDQFAAATGDRQWIHVDVERAKTGPFGSTVAHGYLTLALVPVILDEVFQVDGAVMILNYGLNRVRFPAAVPVGSELRGTVEVRSAALHGSDVQAELRVTIQVPGAERPCCVAEPVLRYVT